MDREELLTKHRQEKKDLQIQVQAIKKSVPKGDKKRDKEAKKQITALESSMKDRHAEELEKLDEFVKTNEVSKVDLPELESLTITADDGDKKVEPIAPKMSKAQRRRRKQEEKAKARQQEIAAAEKDITSSARYKEKIAIISQLQKMGSTIKEMKPDGNCLYHAFLDQAQPMADDLATTRLKVADYLRKNGDHFKFFLVDNSTGECYSDNKYEEYCQKTELDGTWGGQLELQALSKVYERLIRVVQADSPEVVIGEEFTSSKPIILTYHRHQLSLGEHYNSIKDIVKYDDCEQDSF